MSSFDGAWTQTDEQSLAEFKTDLNKDERCIFKTTDIRILSQLLLDYLDGLKGPILSQVSIKHIAEIVIKMKRGDPIEISSTGNVSTNLDVASNQHKRIDSSQKTQKLPKALRSFTQELARDKFCACKVWSLLQQAFNNSARSKRRASTHLQWMMSQ